MKSKLQLKPKSKVLKKGYINIYSELTLQEKRQIFFKTLYKKENPEWDESMVYLSKKLKDYLSGNGNLLDIGCGNGNYLVDENRKKIRWATGIDVDKNSVKKNKCLDEIAIGNIEKLPFKNNSFDIVTSLWVLEHIKNPEEAVREVNRVLKPNGIFIFVTPNFNYLPLRIMKWLNLLNVNPILNKVLYGREEKDIFKTYYRANSAERIRNLVKNYFRIVELRTNFDPSYTSFNKITYLLTKLMNTIFTSFGLNVTHPHLIGVLEKK